MRPASQKHALHSSKAAPKFGRLVRLRWLAQVVFFAAFVLLLARTEFRGSLHAGTDIRLVGPVRWFLEIDPLVAISNALATRALYRGLLWSLVIILPTLLLGRFFCGWICPLGSLNHFLGNLKSDAKLGKARLESNRWKRWQNTKYYLLIALLLASLLGSQLTGLFDPISLTVRSFALSVLPAVNYGANAFFDGLYRTNIGVLQLAGEVLRFVLSHLLLSFRQSFSRQAFLLGVIFLFILCLNLRITRFWCRAICPLGALLGILSRWSILGLDKHAAHCEDCNLCLLHCQGADEPIPAAKWRKAECHLCLNCVAACPEGGVEFRFFPNETNVVRSPNLQRRKAIAGVAAGLAVIPLLRSSTALAAEHHERLLRPPGSLDERNFLARCIHCGECMKACPNNALHPTLTEAGWEGLWTPVLVPRVGYCEPSCVLCGQACPTGAIWEITSREKGWEADPTGAVKPIRIGTAFYDRGRCLPWAMATPCIVCEEWCPTSPKAIYLRPAEVIDAQGKARQVQQPWLDPERCVGCGACEFACPVQERPAVYVTSIGESRSKTNQFLLQKPKPARSVTQPGAPH